MSSHGSSSRSSSSGSEYKTIRQISRERMLLEMLCSSESKEKVLIVDKHTLKVVSCCWKMTDMTNEAGVVLVEDLHLTRKPHPSHDAIYFVQPSRENVVQVLSDMSGKTPLYRDAYVFFSSAIDPELVNLIKNDKIVRPRIGALSEMNLEYIAIDRQGFITGNERALEELYGQNMQNAGQREACLNVMATRIATVFASLGEFPSVRYRAGKVDAFTLTTMRDLLPTKLAAAVWNQLMEYKDGLQNFPQTETCELLILDRSVDQISPIIHEWTYDAMCHDLLNMDGNKYVQEVAGKTGGQPEKKDFLLEDHDPIWLELCHAHIGDVCERLNEKMKTFVSENKAAQVQDGSRNGAELEIRDMKKVTGVLQNYTDQLDKLSLHIEIAEKINRIVRETGLGDLAELEQDLVFGDAGRREVKNFLTTKQDVTLENKLRLMMIYSVAYPEDFEGEKGLELMQLAGLTHGDMNAVNNMRLFDSCSAARKISTGFFTLKFGGHKKRSIRNERKDEEQTWANSRFYPKIEELIEKLTKGELPKNEYACMNAHSQSVHGSRTGHSVRTRRTGSSSSGSRRMGKRIFVFIIGGATRAELRVCHQLSEKFQREIILGSSSLDDPPQFITKMKMLTTEFDNLDI